MTIKRLGFFTRLLDEVDAHERYRRATEQIVWAEKFGFDSAWVAQHHFDESEGGLPAPLVFLAQIAARTSRIRLGTGIITLPMESPVRVAEDAAVLDILSGGRLEVGMGTGGTASAFAAFGLDSARRSEIFGKHLAVVLDAWRGSSLSGKDGPSLYPQAPHLADRVWQATFSVAGGARAGQAGDGLMLSRTQPRPADAPNASLADIQNPIIDAYLAALPPGREPRILGSRSVLAADSRTEARRHAEIGLRRIATRFAKLGQTMPGDSLDDLIAGMDVHLGPPDEVIASLKADATLSRVTDLVFQVHSVDPPHPMILRSIELAATEVAPALGWRSACADTTRRLTAAH